MRVPINRERLPAVWHARPDDRNDQRGRTTRSGSWGRGYALRPAEFLRRFRGIGGVRILVLAHATAPCENQHRETIAGCGWACVKRSCTEPYRVVLRYQGTDDPSTLR